MGDGQDLEDHSDDIRDDHHETLVFEREFRLGLAKRRGDTCDIGAAAWSRSAIGAA